MSVRAVGGGVWEMRCEIRRRGGEEEMRALEARLRSSCLHAERGVGIGGDPVRELMPRFLRIIESKRKYARSTVLGYRRDLCDLAARLGRIVGSGLIGDVRLDQITADAVEDLQIELSETLAAGTVNNKIARLKAFARWAIKTGRWRVRAEGVDWLYVDDLPHRARYPRPLNETDLATVLGVLPDHVAIVLGAQAMTVDRPGAVCALRIEDDTRPVNGRPGMLLLGHRKGGQPRVVSYSTGSVLDGLLSRARDLLAATLGRAARGTDPYFVTRPSGGRPRAWTTSTLDHMVKYYLGRAEIPTRLRGTVPYTIRHSIITWAAQDGATTYDRQHLAGHLRETTCLVYTHATGEEARGARERMEARLGSRMRRLLYSGAQNEAAESVPA